MPPRKFIQAVLVAVCAMQLMCVSSAITAEGLPQAGVADQSADGDGGVPDGEVANDAVMETASPDAPAAPRVEEADRPGSAIYSPFTDLQNGHKLTAPPLAKPLVNDVGAVELTVTLVLALAGVAAFGFFLRRHHP
jgi:hypothetical protein